MDNTSLHCNHFEHSLFNGRLKQTVDPNERMSSYTCNGVVHVAPGFAIVIFRSLDDYQVSREVHPPGQSAGGYQNLREGEK